jgi:hypothetical protein
MKNDDALEFGDYFVNGTPFAPCPDAWVHIAAMVRKASDWEDATRICREYGMISDFNVASEIADLYDLHDFESEDLANDLSEFFGVSMSRLDKALDAFLPHKNPKGKHWGEAYRQELVAIREELINHPNNHPL